MCKLACMHTCLCFNASATGKGGIWGLLPAALLMMMGVMVVVMVVIKWPWVWW